MRSADVKPGDYFALDGYAIVGRAVALGPRLSQELLVLEDDGCYLYATWDKDRPVQAMLVRRFAHGDGLAPGGYESDKRRAFRDALHVLADAAARDVYQEDRWLATR